MLLADVDVVVAAVALQEHDRRASGDHLALLREDLDDAAVLRRAQRQALLLDFELLELHDERLLLLRERIDVVAHIARRFALLRDGRQAYGIRIARILRARQQLVEELLLLRDIGLRDIQGHLRIVELRLRDSTGIEQCRLAVVVDLAVLERGLRRRDGCALLVDLAEALLFIRVRLHVVDRLRAARRADLRVELRNLRLRALDREVRIRRVKLHDDIAGLDRVTLLDRLLEQAAAHAVE